MEKSMNTGSGPQLFTLDKIREAVLYGMTPELQKELLTYFRECCTWRSVVNLATEAAAEMQAAEDDAEDDDAQDARPPMGKLLWELREAYCIGMLKGLNLANEATALQLEALERENEAAQAVAEAEFSKLPKDEQERRVYIDLIARKLPRADLGILRFVHSFIGETEKTPPHPDWHKPAKRKLT